MDPSVKFLQEVGEESLIDTQVTFKALVVSIIQTYRPWTPRRTSIQW